MPNEEEREKINEPSAYFIVKFINAEAIAKL